MTIVYSDDDCMLRSWLYIKMMNLYWRGLTAWCRRPEASPRPGSFWGKTGGLRTRRTLTWTFAGHQWASHQAKKSQDKTPGVFFHAAFDFDTPGPWSTAQKSKNKTKTNLYKIDFLKFWPNHDLRLRICMIFHADSESDLKTTPNEVNNKILQKNQIFMVLRP